ncbi:MAG: Gfo/Idh/MocA family protein [Acidimicrobiales bacterium]
MIDVAVVGAGAIAPSHVEAYLRFSERCRIVAVVDIYPEKATRLVERFGLNAVVADDVHDVLGTGAPAASRIGSSGPDLVSVCTPPGTHASIAIDALDSGSAVLVEKPMSTSLAECDAMLAAAQRSGRLLSVVAQNRFRTPMMRLKRTLEAGLAGRILHAQVESYWWRGPSYYDLWWRGTWQSEGGGPTLNHAVHHLDALQWAMGLPVEVQAIMANLAHESSEVEDLSMAIMRFADGSLGQATSSVVHHGEEQQMVFQGERARVSVPWRVYASSPRANGFPDRDLGVEAEIERFAEAVPVLEHEGHAGQIDDVLTALESRGRPLVDGVEGRKTLELISAIYASAVTGSPVRLPLGLDSPYYSSRGLLETAPRYHEKLHSLTEFTSNEITTAPKER